MYRLGLDIKSSSIQAILLKKGLFGNIKVEALNSIELEDGAKDDNELLKKYSAGIKKVIHSAIPHAIAKKYIAITAIPESKIFSHIFILPKNVEDKNIESAMLIEAEKIIPYPINELYYDFQLIKEQEENKKVLFACIPKIIADQFLNIFRSIGIQVRTFALHTNADRNSLLNEKITDEITMLIDIGHQSTHIIVTKSSEIIETEYIHLGLHDFMKSENKEDIIIQIRETMQKALKQTHLKNPKEKNTLFICGNALEDTKFNQCLEKNIKMKYEIANPWKNISIDKELARCIKQNDEISKKKALSFSTAIGLAIQDFLPKIKKRHDINLLPHQIKEDFKLKQLLRNIQLATLLLTVAILTLLYYLIKDTSELYFKVKKLEGGSDRSARIINSETYKQTNNMLTEVAQESNSLEEMTKNQYSIHDILSNLITYIPREIKMTKIDLKTSEYQVDLSGIAKTREDMLTTIETLKKFPYLKKLDYPLSVLEKKENISFTIKISLDESKLPKIPSK